MTWLLHRPASSRQKRSPTSPTPGPTSSRKATSRETTDPEDATGVVDPGSTTPAACSLNDLHRKNGECHDGIVDLAGVVRRADSDVGHRVGELRMGQITAWQRARVRQSRRGPAE